MDSEPPPDHEIQTLVNRIMFFIAAQKSPPLLRARIKAEVEQWLAEQPTAQPQPQIEDYTSIATWTDRLPG